MGTDIHLVIEEKWSWQKEWMPADEWLKKDEGIYMAREHDVWRNYDVFRRLAGVRDDGLIEPIAEPRGLPADAHAVTRAWADDSDYHDMSWISMQEFKNAFPWSPKFEDMTHFALVCYPYLHSQGPACHGNVRFIFGFDS